MESSTRPSGMADGNPSRTGANHHPRLFRTTPGISVPGASLGPASAPPPSMAGGYAPEYAPHGFPAPRWPEEWPSDPGGGRGGGTRQPPQPSATSQSLAGHMPGRPGMFMHPVAFGESSPYMVPLQCVSGKYYGAPPAMYQSPPYGPDGTSAAGASHASLVPHAQAPPAALYGSYAPMYEGGGTWVYPDDMVRTAGYPPLQFNAAATESETAPYGHALLSLQRQQLPHAHNAAGLGTAVPPPHAPSKRSVSTGSSTADQVTISGVKRAREDGPAAHVHPYLPAALLAAKGRDRNPHETWTSFSARAADAVRGLGYADAAAVRPDFGVQGYADGPPALGEGEQVRLGGRFSAKGWAPGRSKYTPIYHNDHAWAVAMKRTKVRYNFLEDAEAFYEGYCKKCDIPMEDKVRPGFDPEEHARVLRKLREARLEAARLIAGEDAPEPDLLKVKLPKRIFDEARFIDTMIAENHHRTV